MAEKLSVASNDAPQSFVELYHWCESWKLRKGHGKDRRLVSWESDGPEVTTKFEQQFRAEMRRLGEVDKARAFPSKAMRERHGSGFRNTRIMAEEVCYQLAIAHGELPEGWAACEQSGIPMRLPPGPLKTTDDLEQWVRFWLNRSKLTTSAQLHPASALQLWIVYSQAQLWFASHGLADDLPTVPSECDAAWEWIKHGQSKGEPPSQRDAERALSELLAMMIPKASGHGGKGRVASTAKRGRKPATDDEIKEACEVRIEYQQKGMGPKEFCEWRNGNKKVGQVGVRWLNAKLALVRKLLKESPVRIPKRFANKIKPLRRVKRAV
jgi:hypothetical protein